MEEPKFRCVTLRAIEELTKDLNFEVKDDLQDWEFLIGDYKDIEKYIQHYERETNTDKKFALMEIIIQTLTDQKDEDVKMYWNTIQFLLKENFKIHEYSIFYWSCFENENLDNCWQVTPFMRSLWKERTVG